MKIRHFIAAILVIAPITAWGQQPQPTVDPRVAPQMLTALESVLALREATIKAMSEDMQKREKAWAEYSKPLWQQPEAPK